MIVPLPRCIYKLPVDWVRRAVNRQPGDNDAFGIRRVDLKTWWSSKRIFCGVLIQPLVELTVIISLDLVAPSSIEVLEKLCVFFAEGFTQRPLSSLVSIAPP